jgi:hypothetical protein
MVRPAGLTILFFETSLRSSEAASHRIASIRIFRSQSVTGEHYLALPGPLSGAVINSSDSGLRPLGSLPRASYHSRLGYNSFKKEPPLRSLQSALRRSSSLAVLAAGASALVLGLAGPVAAQSIPGPLKVTDSGPSGSPGYAIKGITGYQNDTGVFGYGTVASSAINIDGIVGYVQTQQSVGVVGWAQSSGTSAYGVYGYSATGPGVYGFNANGAIASIYGVSTASGGYAMYGSATSGVGVYGDSGGEDGVFGTTETTATTSGYGGVGGRDESAACCNWGVWGVSNAGGGLYGASYASGGTGGAGILAYAYDGSDSIDSYAYGESTFGINAYNDNGLVAGYFEAGDGSFNSEGGMGYFGVIATNETSGSGAILASFNGVGAEVYGQNGGAATPVLAAEEDTAGMYAFSTYNDTSGNSGGPGLNNESFIVSDTANASQAAFPNGADVNISGDLYVTGFIYDNCSFSFPQTGGSAGCDTVPAVVRPTSSGTKVHAYSTTASLPTMEDFGEGQLVNGQAVIPLEHTFASTIDRTRSYLVFITPEGDSHGLFVATKTASGFTVRESMGGHSTLAFQYRIVAHPYGDSSTRLSSVIAKSRGMSAGHRLAHPLMARSAQLASILSKAKTLRSKNGHLTPHIPARQARPTTPVVNAVLRKY